MFGLRVNWRRLGRNRLHQWSWGIPSRKATTRRSCDTRTLSAKAEGSASTLEMVIPGLDQDRAVLPNDSNDRPEFVRMEVSSSRDGDSRRQPESILDAANHLAERSQRPAS